MNKKQNLNRLHPCPDSNQFFLYIDGALDQNERKVLEEHLNLCPSCFSEMTSLVRDTFPMVKPDEHIALMNIRCLSQEEQVTRILAYQEHGHFDVRISHNILNNAFNILRGYLIGNHPRFRPVWIMGAVSVILIVLFLGIPYFRTSYPIRQAQNLLKSNYRIFIENPRLSGGYQSTGISMLMSADDQSFSYLETAQNDLLKAIHRGAKSQIATQLLAQIYIIERNYYKADSLLNNILNHSSHLASVYNDLGVLYADQKQWTKAINQLESAIAMDNRYNEAYYNLALIKIKIGSMNDAISLLTKYLTLETDMSWKDAAEHLLDEIKRKKGERYN